MELIFWLAALVIFTLAEAATVGLTSIWFAVGALFALIAAMLGATPWVQVILFIAFSAVSLLLLRPLAKKYLKPSYKATNADRVLGQIAIVTEEISNLRATGQVSVFGQPWTARSEHDVVIPKDSHVKVLRIEGVKLFVEMA